MLQTLTAAKANPARSASIANGAERKIDKLDEKFVAANGAHGLSCF
jgi:hypothetical protein